MGEIHFAVYRATSDQFDLSVLCHVLLHGWRQTKKPDRVQTALSVFGAFLLRVTEVASRVASECFEQLLARPTTLRPSFVITLRPSRPMSSSCLRA